MNQVRPRRSSLNHFNLLLFVLRSAAPSCLRLKRSAATAPHPALTWHQWISIIVAVLCLQERVCVLTFIIYPQGFDSTRGRCVHQAGRACR